MPEISRFFGMVITMYYNDHAPPHFHARYGAHEIRMGIETGAVLSGRLPPRALRLVKEWRTLHRGELLVDWRLAGARRPLKDIAPLE